MSEISFAGTGQVAQLVEFCKKVPAGHEQGRGVASQAGRTLLLPPVGRARAEKTKVAKARGKYIVADGDGDEIVEIEIDRRSLGVWFLEVIAVIEALRLFMEVHQLPVWFFIYFFNALISVLTIVTSLISPPLV